MNSRWTQEEIDILSDNRSLLIVKLMELLPHRSKASIFNKRKYLGWTPSTYWNSNVEHQTCIHCKQIKHIDEFDIKRAVKRNRRTICKVCRNNAANTRYRKYAHEWRSWFRKQYPCPRCAVCDKELNWTKNSYNIPHFDHRHNGQEPIQKTPTTFCQNYPCNDKNKLLWNLCDFGILCNECNCRLPTMNRVNWLRLAAQYAGSNI